MRLNEFDGSDKNAFSLKTGNTLENKLKEIEVSVASNKDIANNFIVSGIGSKIKILSILESLILEIKEFYDFCNQCNDDSETRDYLDKLAKMHNEISLLLDKLK